MTDIMILAAGLGTRMKSRRAKVLHELAGRPLIGHVLRATFDVSPETIFTVVGHQAAEVEQSVKDQATAITKITNAPSPNLEFVVQTEQKGTGHAVMAAREKLVSRRGSLIIVAGDAPLIESTTLRHLVGVHEAKKNDCTMLTVILEDPTGYGRIIRNGDGSLQRCVEHKDATSDERAIQEVGVSIYCFEVGSLLKALDRLTTDNAQGEYYLTDVPRIMQEHGNKVGLLLHPNADEVLGINTRVELADLERRLRDRKNRELMLSGVTLIDPASTYIELDVQVGKDTVISPQVVLQGNTRIGEGCSINSWSRLKNVEVGNGVRIDNSCVMENCVIQDGAELGPFARLRIGAEIGEKARIGNFVEVKQSKVGKGSKASHLTYLGNAKIGERVNVGAGTVTCNYDGVVKNETIIEDDVKIGSDTMLVAPVRIGKGSVTGAGSVITKDVPPDSLAVGVPASIRKKLK